MIKSVSICAIEILIHFMFLRFKTLKSYSQCFNAWHEFQQSRCTQIYTLKNPNKYRLLPTNNENRIIYQFRRAGIKRIFKPKFQTSEEVVCRMTNPWSRLERFQYDKHKYFLCINGYIAWFKMKNIPLNRWWIIFPINPQALVQQGKIPLVLAPNSGFFSHCKGAPILFPLWSTAKDQMSV